MGRKGKIFKNFQKKTRLDLTFLVICSGLEIIRREFLDRGDDRVIK